MRGVKNISLVVTIFCFFSQWGYSSGPDSVADNKNFQDQAVSAFIRCNFGTNYFYYGRTFSGNKPFYSTDLTLMHKSGLLGAVSLYHLYNEKPYINYYDLTVGWQDELTEWFDMGFFYTRFVFPQINTDGSAVGFNFWTFQAGFDWKVLYTSLNGSVLSGDQADFYLTIKNSHYIQTKKISKTDLYFSFDPSFTFVAGSRDYYKVTIIRRRPGRWPGGIVIEEERSFQILDFEFNLPVALNWRKLTLEPSVMYYYPINLSYNDLSKEGFHFYLSFYISL